MQQRSDTLILISLYHFACALGNLLVTCGMLTLPLLVAASTADSGSDGATATAIVAVIGIIAGGVFLLLALANAIVGWGLWQQREWGRIGAIVLAIVRLINIPFGTIIGGLIIWALLQEQGRREFMPVG